MFINKMIGEKLLKKADESYVKEGKVGLKTGFWMGLALEFGDQVAKDKIVEVMIDVLEGTIGGLH